MFNLFAELTSFFFMCRKGAETYLNRVCYVPAPYKGTLKWRRYGLDTDQVRIGYVPEPCLRPFLSEI